MTGNISYKGTKASYEMIKFIDNTGDVNGNGISIGGGGLTIVGGGESSDAVKSIASGGGDERLILSNDGPIDIYTNCQNGLSKATHVTIDNSGLYSGTAAKANSVPWSGVTGKPSTFTPSGHTHKMTDISDWGSYIYDAHASRTANTVLAAPSGSNGTATFRKLVAADIPSITKSKISDFPGSLPASDVYAWAKASTKPSYSWGEITGKPGTFTPASHSHSYIAASLSSSAVPAKAADGRVEFYYNVNNGLANNMPSTNNANAIISLSRHSGDYPSQLGFSSNGNIYYREGVGTTAWKTIITSSNYTSYTTTKTGGGASGTWSINVTGSAGSVAWGNVSGKPSTYTPSSHTHNYAGSGSAGGSANSAVKLDSSAGSATQPVYFSGGKPVACSYTLGKSVPADAKFTDTNTWRGVQNNLTSTATDQSLSAAMGKALNDGKLAGLSANGYWGMGTPSGSASDWIRTTSVGIIPYQSGGRGSGHSGLGTSSWYFSSSYIDHMYSTDVKIADKVTLQYDSTNACLNFVFS